eukprot:1157220-Pelagomonas_calceolata.AAC.6
MLNSFAIVPAGTAYHSIQGTFTAVHFPVPATHLITQEAVPQHSRELGTPEGHMPCIRVKRPDALLQGQQGLVDLSAL